MTNEERRRWAMEQALAYLAPAECALDDVTQFADALLTWLSDPGAAHEPDDEVAL